MSDRGHYFFSVFASRMMVAQGRGLIVTISSMGGLRYLFSVPYGVGKAAVSCSLVSSYVTEYMYCIISTVWWNLFCGLFQVWQAGSRHGCGAEKEGCDFCQPVAGGGTNRVGVSVHIGEKYTTGWKFFGRLLLNNKSMIATSFFFFSFSKSLFFSSA